MHKTIKTKIQHRSLLSGLAAMLVMSTSQAVILSPEELTEYASEEAYWVVTVDCENGSDPRVIQRKTDGNQWCGKEVEGYCYETKAEAADQVCGVSYSSAFTNQKRAEEERQRQEQARQQAEQQRRQAEARAQAARLQAEEAKRQNQIKLDEQLLQIEQEKLSLRRQELELQRRAVEIREALEALDNQE